MEQGLVDSREKARTAIMAGQVMAGDRVISKPGLLLANTTPLRLLAKQPFVSRGGQKLDRALDAFGLDVTGAVAVDVGASTGGFTDCLLKRGAERVYAVDVGYGLIDWSLRQDPRVVVMERVNARNPFPLPEAAGIATVDVSFISLEKVLPSIARVLRPGGPIVALVKPQFEAGRDQVGKGGIVRDPQVHAQVLARVIVWALDHGFRLNGLTPSPILGTDGNREFFVCLSSHPRAD